MTGIPSAWQALFADAGRLHEVADGILADSRCRPAFAQKEEVDLRDAVAEPFFRSPGAAVAEAARHHSRGVMLRRAREQVARVTSRTAAGERIIVDLGCGFGWHWVDLSAENPTIRFVLIDFSMTNLRVCRTLMPVERHSNVLCVQASILDLPLREAVADLAWSVQVMQHMAGPERALALHGMKRLLKPGGAFYVAWLRDVPAVRALYALAAKRYHRRGRTPLGLHLDRFDDSIRDELLAVFPSGRISRSESLFHPELRLRPPAVWIGGLDLALSGSPLGGLLARQAEFSGET
ncbi:MAG TPA: class I SAM-dependent methyltransferase [Thermoanaerobaculia bacterium]|nr:class I SAM-dependent methyltransferase [Thermoanaerobaculia bacterium]